MPVSFTVTSAEQDTISKIARRAVQDYAGLGVTIDQMSLVMDLTAVHANGCPIDLDGLLAAPPFDFGHDISGIMRHLDRTTGALGDCFIPRTAARQGD